MSSSGTAATPSALGNSGHESGKLDDLFDSLRRSQLANLSSQRGPLDGPLRRPVSDPRCAKNFLFARNAAQGFVYSYAIMELEMQTWNDDKLDHLETRLGDGFRGVEERFVEVDRQFEKVNGRFEQIDARFATVDKRFDKLDARFEKADQRFERIEERFSQTPTREEMHQGFAEIRDEMNQGFAENRRALVALGTQFHNLNRTLLAGAVAIILALIGFHG